MKIINIFSRWLPGPKPSDFKRFEVLRPTKRTGVNMFKYGGLLNPGQYCSITTDHLIFYIGENVNNYLFEVSIYKNITDPIEAPHGSIIEINKENFKKFGKNFQYVK